MGRAWASHRAVLLGYTPKRHFRITGPEQMVSSSDIYSVRCSLAQIHVPCSRAERALPAAANSVIQLLVAVSSPHRVVRAKC